MPPYSQRNTAPRIHQTHPADFLVIGKSHLSSFLQSPWSETMSSPSLDFQHCLFGPKCFHAPLPDRHSLFSLTSPKTLQSVGTMLQRCRDTQVLRAMEEWNSLSFDLLAFGNARVLPLLPSRERPGGLCLSLLPSWGMALCGMRALEVGQLFMATVCSSEQGAMGHFPP